MLNHALRVTTSRLAFGGPVGRLHHSTGVACATLLLILGCWSVSDGRLAEKRAKPVVTRTDLELSIQTALTESSPTRTQVPLVPRG